MNGREECLDLAKKCVCGARETDYGSPEDNFMQIAELWNDYIYALRRKRGDKFRITSIDVAMLMVLLKVARTATGNGSSDNFIDIAGYSACAFEMYTRWNATNTNKEDSNEN